MPTQQQTYLDMELARQEIAFACPECHGEVQQHGAAHFCEKCGEVGRTIDGIPCFADPAYYWGEIPEEEMRQVNAAAVENGWQAAVQQHVSNPELRNYTTSLRRADFQHIWDLPRGSQVLDIGAGWGAIAHALAQNFKVTAAEGVLERTRFIHTRARQTGAAVTPVCADFLRLPFAENQFDAVVLNGVVEWIGLARKTGDPRDLQLEFLRRVRQLLKPGGFACIGIENRIGWAMLAGARDHSGLPYTSLMPRWMADYWCSRRNGGYRSDRNQGYRAYTYSLGGYHKLFREAGFAGVRTFHAWDGYNQPSTLIPLDNPHAVRHFLERLDRGQMGWKGSLKNIGLSAAIRMGLWKRFASDYIFVAEKS